MNTFKNSPCGDMFQHIIENADFYSSIEGFHTKVKYFESKVQSMPLTEERFNIQLSVLYLKIQRIGTNLDIEAARSVFGDITKHLNCNNILEIKYKIVQAQYYLIIKEEFIAAKSLLEELVIILRNTDHHLLYALVSKALCGVYMMLGNTSTAEDYAQDAVTTFRRIGSKLLYAHSLNNYGVLKKKICRYAESEILLKKSLKVFQECRASDGEAACYNNLGSVKMKLGEWDDAIHYYEKATDLKKNIYLTVGASLKQKLNLEHLYLLKRHFKRSENHIRELLNVYSEENILKQKALALEFLGELYTETKEYKKAKQHLDQAEDVAKQCAPESDVMTEITRRKAQYYLITGEFDKALHYALDCIQLSNKIGDKLEMGAALRVLGEIYLATEKPRKAVSAFQASIHTLKSIHECYELMRSCISYSEYLIGNNSREAEVYLLEAKQLCNKVKLDYYMSQIMILMGRQAMNNGNYAEARTYLRKAERLCKSLQTCDQNKVKPLIKNFYNKLEGTVLKVSMDSAEKFKAIGKIYEEARFPLEEARQELALEVAHNVGAESLFLVRQATRGYIVSLAHNIQIKEAKRVTEIIDLKCKKSLFTNNSHPKIHKIGDEKVVVCIPGQSDTGNVLFAVINGSQEFTPQQLEFLFASIEVMERMAEEYPPKRPDVEEDEFIQDGTKGISHPGGSFKKIITIDRDLIKIIHLAKRASKSDVPVLLEGETGVGKELFAKAIHESSRRRTKEFVAMNAGGVPVNFLESQLFGHVKGAFTDACTDRIGLIEESSGGSIFFDEIGDMPEELQVKLLRLLENGEYRRLGENKLRYADIRVISATNKDLTELVEKELFRKDLYYRLAGVRFCIPPLRSRKWDVELLIRHFLRETMKLMDHKNHHVGIDMKTIDAFELYDWPGNIRELLNEIIRIISLIGDGEVIRFGMLSDSIKNYFRLHSDKGLLERNVERYERRLILKALENNDWNRIRTAAEIGIPRTTLIGKMKRLNIVA
jgi:transcriptional regulator with PAS, ATPase and Fis domain/Tfp pilus assembly protein PilF